MNDKKVKSSIENIKLTDDARERIISACQTRADAASEGFTEQVFTVERAKPRTAMRVAACAAAFAVVSVGVGMAVALTRQSAPDVKVASTVTSSNPSNVAPTENTQPVTASNTAAQPSFNEVCPSFSKLFSDSGNTNTVLVMSDEYKLNADSWAAVDTLMSGISDAEITNWTYPLLYKENMTEVRTILGAQAMDIMCDNQDTYLHFYKIYDSNLNANWFKIPGSSTFDTFVNIVTMNGSGEKTDNVGNNRIELPILDAGFSVTYHDGSGKSANYDMDNYARTKIRDFINGASLTRISADEYGIPDGECIELSCGDDTLIIYDKAAKYISGGNTSYYRVNKVSSESTIGVISRLLGSSSNDDSAVKFLFSLTDSSFEMEIDGNKWSPDNAAARWIATLLNYHVSLDTKNGDVILTSDSLPPPSDYFTITKNNEQLILTKSGTAYYSDGCGIYSVHNYTTGFSTDGFDTIRSNILLYLNNEIIKLPSVCEPFTVE